MIDTFKRRAVEVNIPCPDYSCRQDQLQVVSNYSSAMVA
jgi:hypothetical protein